MEGQITRSAKATGEWWNNAVPSENASYIYFDTRLSSHAFIFAPTPPFLRSDTDEDCAGSLVCFQSDLIGETVPGCSGVTDGSTDYCFTPTVHTGNLALFFLGDELTSYSECQGDCDSDSEVCGSLQVCISFLPYMYLLAESINSLTKHHFVFLHYMYYFSATSSSVLQVCVASSEEVPTPTQGSLIAMAPGSQEKTTAINRRKPLPPLLRPTFLLPRLRLALKCPKSRHSLPAP